MYIFILYILDLKLRKKLFTASGKPKSAFSIYAKQSSHVSHGCGDETLGTRLCT